MPLLRQPGLRHAMRPGFAMLQSPPRAGFRAPCTTRSLHGTRRAPAAGGRYQEWRSESFTVIGVDPQRCGMMQAHAPPTAAALGGPWATLGLLLAAALAGESAGALRDTLQCRGRGLLDGPRRQL